MKLYQLAIQQILELTFPALAVRCDKGLNTIQLTQDEQNRCNFWARKLYARHRCLKHRVLVYQSSRLI